MKQRFHTRRKGARGLRRYRFSVDHCTATQSRDRRRKLIDILRSPSINPFCPDWFAQRIWEDDGGGQAQLS